MEYEVSSSRGVAAGVLRDYISLGKPRVVALHLITAVAGMFLAAFGYLSPVLAGGAMALSSVSVVSNSLRLRRFKLKKD